jgi:glycosyltransferase involved in cell wall biosynthesis
LNTAVRSPHLESLPPPPVGRTGWPWTVASAAAPPARPDGSQWPRVSIVTPSYNQGQYLEETVRSVLLQGYPNLEYIIIDGGSTDNSVDVIRKYESWIAYWASEKDHGQADAINKGLARATGEIFQFINSDDLLAVDAVQAVARAINGFDAAAGVVVDFDAEGNQTSLASRNLAPVNFITKPSGFLYHQPGVWLRAELVRALDGFNSMYRYKFDWELQLRYAERWPRVAYIDDVLALFRLHDASKTMSEGMAFWEEELVVRDLLLQRVVDSRTRTALKRFVRHRHWRIRVDELVRGLGLTQGQAVASLCREAMQDPFRRIDRYSLGALRRILAGR